MERFAVPLATLLIAVLLLAVGSQRSFAEHDNSHFTPERLLEVRAMMARPE